MIPYSTCSAFFISQSQMEQYMMMICKTWEGCLGKTHTLRNAVPDLHFWVQPWNFRPCVLTEVSRPVLANLELPVSFRAAVYLDIFGWHSGLGFREPRKVVQWDWCVENFTKRPNGDFRPIFFKSKFGIFF